MIPITRKELYLNKIVGNNDYETPEKPITEEEFFFAEILGEAVQAPAPLTRYQIYLAKIAGKDVEIPYPETRLEYFLAKAAGMDITVPVPITREEIYWSNYTAIVEFELEGVPPLTYKAIEGTLTNYRIYGQTSRNLFDFGEWSKNINANGDNSLVKGIDGITITANSNDAFTTPYAYVHEGVYKIYVKTNTNYLLSWVSNNNLSGRVFIFKNGISYGTHAANANNDTTKYLLFGTDADTAFITLRFGVTTAGGTITYSKIMLNEGSTPLPYEPYGESVGDLVTSGEHAGEYKVPMTVSNGTDTLTTPIYLPEPIKMVGDEAEYIDYGGQKMHRIGADDIDVTLPALPTLTGTNVLSVGTAVQPSKVYVKYKGERQ